MASKSSSPWYTSTAALVVGGLFAGLGLVGVVWHGFTWVKGQLAGAGGV